MKFKLWREHGALNSPPVFAAVEQGLKNIGMAVVNDHQDVDVIWSVLWYGRMKSNKFVFDQAKNQNRPVMIIEVGNLFRGRTWRLSLDHIHGLGKFGNDCDLDLDRPRKLGAVLRPINENRKENILIACQHEHSLQWQGQPSMVRWVADTVDQIRQYSDRPIEIRPHPRSPININLPGTRLVRPVKIPNSYDDFDIDYSYHCVINFNSGPAVRSAIEGNPVICDQSSLAYPVSDRWVNLEDPKLPDREEWFLKLCHTEWTIPEIQSGLPFTRIFPRS
jgi:hypothetical protein